MSINAIGFSEFYPIKSDLDPLRYKTDIFKISSEDSITDIYTYLQSNPSIYYQASIPIPDTWGDETAYPTVGYNYHKHEWIETSIPDHPIVLHWNFKKCDTDGLNCIPLVNITTPLNNTRLWNSSN